MELNNADHGKKDPAQKNCSFLCGERDFKPHRPFAAPISERDGPVRGLPKSLVFRLYGQAGLPQGLTFDTGGPFRIVIPSFEFNWRVLVQYYVIEGKCRALELGVQIVPDHLRFEGLARNGDLDVRVGPEAAHNAVDLQEVARTDDPHGQCPFNDLGRRSLYCGGLLLLRSTDRGAGLSHGSRPTAAPVP